MAALPSISNRNIRNTLSDIAVQLNHANGVRGRAKTCYYRICVVLIASIMETMLHHIIEEKVKKDPSVLDIITRLDKKFLHTLPKILESPKNLIICEVINIPFNLKDSSFKDKNEFALKSGLIKKRLYNLLDKLRKKRNEIHLMTLTTTNRTFSIKLINKSAEVLIQLFDVLYAI